MNIALGALKRVQADPSKTPYVLDRLIDYHNKRNIFGSNIHKAEAGLVSVCGYMHIRDSLSANLKICEDHLELSIKRQHIQILRALKSAKTEELTEALSSALFPLLDSPEMAIDEAENQEYEDGRPPSLSESIGRWKRLAMAFKKVPRRYRKQFQFSLSKGVSARLGDETCYGLMLCPSDTSYDPHGDHANDDFILLNRADNIRAWIMEASNTNCEIVLESAHKDVDRLLETASRACDALTFGFAKLMSVSREYLHL
jgi:hypothetical protein